MHSISRTSSGTRLEIDSGTGMSIGLNNEGLSLSDDQLHKPVSDSKRGEGRGGTDDLRYCPRGSSV